MEHESLEDLKGVAITNKDYINVINRKVDREEHPDVGQVYMSPIKLMIDNRGQQPNVIPLPDRSPIWGGAYFPKRDCIRALDQIVRINAPQPEKLEEENPEKS